jgi:hypothetical protein
MTADTQLIPAALDEAEAIVEAEWMRLTWDGDQWEREVTEFLAEMPAPRRGPPRGRTTTTTTTAVCRRPTALPPRRTSAMCPARRSPAPTVWATQRSPPAGHTRTNE